MPGFLLLRAGLAQLLGWAAALLAAALQANVLQGPASPWVPLAAASLGAALAARALRLPVWWWWIQAAFPPLLWLGLLLDLPPLAYATALLLCLALFGAVFRSRVPLWLSGRRARHTLLAHLPDGGSLRMVDLGAGLGGVVAAVQRARPQAEVLGIEWALLPFLLGRMRLATAGYRGRWRWGSFWACDLGRFDLAYAYLSPAAMPALWEKASREMPRGSLLVSYRFGIPGRPPDETWVVGDHDDALMVWRMPGPAAG